MRTKRLWLMVVVLVLMQMPALCWGPTAHTLITENALELLPVQMKPFFDSNSRYIVALCLLPDHWRQTHKAEIGMQHSIDLDRLDTPPFSKLDGTKAEVEARFGKDKVAEMGVLPWVIEERFAKLTEAIRRNDPEDIVVQAAVLAHFVADAHVPLHLTRFYDGRTPEQKGLHFRWEEGLVSFAIKPESLHACEPEKISDIRKAAFGWAVQGYSQLDRIFAAEDKARAVDSGHGYGYYKILSQQTGTMLADEMSSAAEALAGAYIAAWEKAGKPDLGDKVAPLYWGR